MSLTTDELDSAREALREIETYRKFLRIGCLNFGVLGLSSVNILRDHPHHWWVRYVIALVFIALGLFYWRHYLWLKSRYPSNLKLLQSLALREGDFVYHLELPHYKPLLESWNRRLEKRALLWRVDRFLSGKSWREPQ